MLWWWIIGCSGQEPAPTDIPDARRYASLVALETPDPDQHLVACAQLHDPDLQGDCSLVVARRAAETRREPPETYCDRLTGDVWQAECFFMAAEDHNDDRDYKRAAELCLRSRIFADHCSQHLWQKGLRGMTWRKGSRAFGGHLERAERLYAHWEPFLAEGTDFEVRFWRRFYEGGFERDRHINLAACDGLPADEHIRRCRTAGASLYTRKIQQISHIQKPMEMLCASNPPSAKTLSTTGVPEFQTTGGPELDAVIKSFQDKQCDGTRPILSERRPLSPAFGGPPDNRR
ncbi:MAG: hypothetical protein AAFV53_38900 [Myxococcota bacterium]